MSEKNWQFISKTMHQTTTFAKNNRHMQTTSKTVLCIKHADFEGPGYFETIFKTLGYHFVTTARSKGQAENIVVRKHMLV